MASRYERAIIVFSPDGHLFQVEYNLETVKKDSTAQYTQSNGKRPFGISALIVAFDDDDGIPQLYQTDPSGTYHAWKVAQSGGKNIELAII